MNDPPRRVLVTMGGGGDEWFTTATGHRVVRAGGAAPAGRSPLRFLISFPNRVVAPARDRSGFIATVDGADWQPIPGSTVPGSDEIKGVIAIGSTVHLFEVIGASGTNRLWTSPDFVSWTLQGSLPCPVAGRSCIINGVAEIGGHLWVVGYVTGSQFVDQRGFLFSWRSGTGFTQEFLTPGNEHVVSVFPLGGTGLALSRGAQCCAGFARLSTDGTVRRTIQSGSDQAVPNDGGCLVDGRVHVGGNDNAVWWTDDGIIWGRQGFIFAVLGQCLEVNGEIVGTAGGPSGFIVRSITFPDGFRSFSRQLAPYLSPDATSGVALRP